MMAFKDYFSRNSETYARFRPRYPEVLFEFLSSLAAAHDTAWDCATGSGQAVEGLTRYFKRIVATDASFNQLTKAKRFSNAFYSVALAERPPFSDHAIDLVTVSQALHWLSHEEFFKAVQRVLKPNGIVAVWCYNLLQTDPAIDSILLEFYSKIVGPYWTPERKLLEGGYRSIHFPFAELVAPEMEMTWEWNLSDLIGYLYTWSATQRYTQTNKSDPVLLVQDRLSVAWGNPVNRRVLRWPLSVRVGRKQP